MNVWDPTAFPLDLVFMLQEEVVSDSFKREGSQAGMFSVSSLVPVAMGEYGMRRTEGHTNSTFSRRAAIQAGAIGLGLSTTHLAGLRALTGAPEAKAKSVIFIFLTGGLSHLDTFDMKPEAPVELRGEFGRISTKTPGLQVCEHLPMLAQRSDRYALLRSMQVDSNAHAQACHMLLTGRLDFPAGFSVDKAPDLNEWPSIPAVATYALRNQRGKLPPAVILPEPSVNEADQVRPGQYAGRLGERWDAWHVDIAAKCRLGNGACPECFRFDGSDFQHGSEGVFELPMLELPEGGEDRLRGRIGLLGEIQQQQRALERAGDEFDSSRRQAISVLADEKVTNAFNVEKADQELRERYGDNKFGLSLLMARRLVESGVNLVQVNLGKNSSWDTHLNNFITLKDNLLPPMDRAVSALLDDLGESGLLDETLVIMTGEFGRTPKINKRAGRDHWGPVNTVMFFGGGVQGGNIIGASDRTGSEPTRDIQLPENFAATIYEALGIPRTGIWRDVDGRPHRIYGGKAIPGLYS